MTPADTFGDVGDAVDGIGAELRPRNVHERGWAESGGKDQPFLQIGGELTGKLTGTKPTVVQRKPGGRRTRDCIGGSDRQIRHSNLRRGGRVRRTSLSLSALDHAILEHLSQHRVLTTTQLTAITSSPVRTVTYRLDRLHRARLVGRTRPYAEAGSAPLHWWPTEAAAASPTGVRPSHARRSIPNPMFMAHAAALADLWLALTTHGPEAGLKLTRWLRDEESWEKWRGIGGAARIAPDAFAEVAVGEDGELVPVFIEVDLATMSQVRLRAKARRYVAYVECGAWQHLHPWPPVLLLLTTSATRAGGFLTAVERLRPRRPYSWDDDDNTQLVVAAAAHVHDPTTAVREAEWRLSVDGDPLTLRRILAEQAGDMRRRRAAEQAAREEAERMAPIEAVFSFRSELSDICRALEDDVAAEVLRAIDSRQADLAAWALAHRDLVLEIDRWWSDRKQRHQAATEWGKRRARIVDRLRPLRKALHNEQARIIAEAYEAGLDDPHLRAFQRQLDGGELLSLFWLKYVIENPKSRADYEREMMNGYAEAREKAVQKDWRELSWLQRLRTSIDALRADFDAQHLLICEDCAVVRPSGRFWDQHHCEICSGTLQRLSGEAVASISRSLATIATS